MDFQDNRLRMKTIHGILFGPEFDPAAKQVSLFIAGFSNETAAVKHPTEKDAQGN
jgi:hypothetical protein